MKLFNIIPYFAALPALAYAAPQDSGHWQTELARLSAAMEEIGWWLRIAAAMGGAPGLRALISPTVFLNDFDREWKLRWTGLMCLILFDGIWGRRG
ncbi:hypothetical protein BJX99DRAFT_265473 [Aspergillus californicus]